MDTTPIPSSAPLPKVVCCWCVPPHVLREGSEPVSHGLCETAKATFDQELLALEKLR